MFLFWPSERQNFGSIHEIPPTPPFFSLCNKKFYILAFSPQNFMCFFLSK